MEEIVNQGEALQKSAPTVDFMVGGQTDGPPIADENDENSYTQRDILHYHFFGRHGVPVSTKATLFSWEKHLPYVKPVKVEWDVQLSEHTLLRLLYGYEPLEMPDKWFIYADGPNRRGTIVVNFIRSWTGTKTAEIMIQTSTDEHGLWTGKIVDLTFEGDEAEAARIADAAIEKPSSRGSLEDADGAAKSSKTSELKPKTETGADEISEQADLEGNTEKRIKENSDSESAHSADSGSDETGETWAKFLVATACKWVMGVNLGVDVSEPRRWTKLAPRPAKSQAITQTTYMGTSLPQETMELLERLGPGTMVTFS